MCGRYRLMKLNLLLHAFPWITGLPFGEAEREDIAPTEAVLVISSDKPDAFDRYRWGLVPAWAKDPSVGNRMFNARAETLAEKSAFRNALRKRRCLIPADGFYEWKKEPGNKHKTKVLYELASGEPFAFAGLWELWRDANGKELRSCTLITTTPNELVKPVHDRMPAIVSPANYREWISSAEIPPAELAELLGPYPADQMRSEAAEPIQPAKTPTLFD
jgi:putative SOS response-associated peptidase YedK